MDMENEISTIEQKLIEGQVVEALRACYDPEIPVNIYELGLVYDVKVSPEAAVAVTMTLTSPACPVAQSLPKEIETRIKAIPGVRGASVNVELELDSGLIGDHWAKNNSPGHPTPRRSWRFGISTPARNWSRRRWTNFPSPRGDCSRAMPPRVSSASTTQTASWSMPS